MPLPVSSDLILINDNLPSYQPNNEREDSVEWVLDRSKVFSVSSAWNALRESKPNVSWYKIVWSKDCIPRCNFILWLVCWNRLSINDILKEWGVVLNSNYVMCGNGEENINHIFFSCVFAKRV